LKGEQLHIHDPPKRTHDDETAIRCGVVYVMPSETVRWVGVGKDLKQVSLYASTRGGVCIE
jgi:hypothetical protein